jgi:hypothetical protein
MKPMPIKKNKIVLFLNTSKDKKLDVFLLVANKVDHLTVKADYKVSEKLLLSISKILSRNKVQLKDISGIITVSGPGPFTSLRIAISVSNTLAFCLQIPVVGVINPENKLKDKELIDIGLRQLLKPKLHSYLQPFYGKEPNITKKK